MNITTHGHFVTKWLLILSMLVIAWVHVGQGTYQALADSYKQTIVAKREVASTLSLDDVESAVNRHIDAVKLLESTDFENYFALLNEQNILIAQVNLLCEAYSADVRIGRLQAQLHNERMNFSNHLLGGDRKSLFATEALQSEAFTRAQRKQRTPVPDYDALVAAAYRSSSTPYPSLWMILQVILFWLPFGMVMVIQKLHQESRADMWVIIRSCFSEWRSFASGATGPFAGLAVDFFYRDSAELKTDMRILLFSCLLLISCHFGGGAVAVSAQNPTPTPGRSSTSKTLKSSLTQRLEEEDGVSTSISMVSVTDIRSGMFAETISSTSPQTASGYMYMGKKLVTYSSKKRNLTFSFGLFGGARFVQPKNKGSFSSAVLGARTWLSKGRLTWNTPLLTYERCVSGSMCRDSGVLITKASLRFTKRISGAFEQFVRVTKSAKARSVTYLLGSYKLGERIVLSGGPFVNHQTGNWGSRLEIQFNFDR